MPEAYIIDAVRTPVGKRGGGLKDVHPADLGAHSISARLRREIRDRFIQRPSLSSTRLGIENVRGQLTSQVHSPLDRANLRFRDK